MILTFDIIRFGLILFIGLIVLLNLLIESFLEFKYEFRFLKTDRDYFYFTLKIFGIYYTFVLMFIYSFYLFGCLIWPLGQLLLLAPPGFIAYILLIMFTVFVLFTTKDYVKKVAKKSK